MIRPWLALTEHWWIVVFLTANGSILCQSVWNSTNCGGSAPTLDRILVDACAPYEPDEYIIFHTGSTSLTIRNGTPSIQVNVTSNPYVSDQWASNSSAIADMNLRAGCGRALFIDPFAPPYNGIIPPYSNVIAFVQRDPGFTGSLPGLCGEGAVFVLFGNFSDGFSSSMFGNSCSGCTRNIDIQLGSCSYDITYEPERLSGENGAYIRGNGNSVYYGNAANCRPEFHQFPTTPAPNLDRESVTICENNSSVPEGFTVTNGTSQTAWYIDPDGSPIHYGIAYVPPRDLFPTPTDGMAEERNLYVANIHGGRPSTMEEISLISLPTPDADGIKLACSPGQNCTICEGENVLLQLDLSGTNGQTLQINLTEGSFNYQLELDGDGVHPIEFPAADQYRILTVSNEFGCTISDGFKNTEVSIDIRSPAVGYLPALPDLCNGDQPFVLPQTPGGLPGIWTLKGQNVTSVDPDQLGIGTFTLNFQPSDRCAETESTDLEILPVPITGFDLPPMNCIDEYYQPVQDLSTSSGGTWTIDPTVGIDPTSGAVNFSDLVPGQTYTWTYTVNGQCTNSSSKSTVVPDCPCEIEFVYETFCNDNGSPTNPLDDVFEFQLMVTGTNTSGQWSSSDDQWSGSYGDTTSLGLFPISDGPINLSIQDSEDPGCLTTFEVDPPETCSDDCSIDAEITAVTCDDQGSPTDPEDDVFEFQLMVTGTNTSGQWTSSDDQWSGPYGDTTSLGLFPISDGQINLSIQDSENPDCLTTFEVDPPETCSDDCSIEAEITAVTCDDQGSPTYPEDDVFEFQLMVTGTNTSGQWTSSDDQWSGPYGDTTSLGLFPISDGPINLSIQDSEDPGCQTTFEVDPPEACSDDCNIETNITDIECDDYGTPVDSTDDIFFVEIEVLGQNASTHWVSEENETGIYGASNLWGPYRVDEGNRSIAIQDALDSNCHTVLEIPETPHCSSACDFNIHVSDSCVWEEDGGVQIYYFIHDNLSDDKQLYEIYYEYSLIDILPGTGDLPIGPFHAVDTGKILTFKPDSSPYCEKNIPIALPYGCRKPQPDTCLLHTTMLEWDPCKVEETLNGRAPSLISEISSNLFPVEVYVNGVVASFVDHPGKHSIPLPQRWMDADDSVQVRFVQPNGCQTFLTIPGSCNENGVYLPNAFSPNQDGINDYWEISLPANSTQIDLKIYDRWGNLITQISDSAVGLAPITWDGTSSSRKIEGGVVVYEISWVRQKKQYHRWGEILILR